MVVSVLNVFVFTFLPVQELSLGQHLSLES